MDVNLPTGGELPSGSGPSDARPPGPGSGGKKLFGIIALVIAAVLFLLYGRPVERYLKQSSNEVLSNLASSSLASQVQNIEKQVSAPPPLRGGDNANGALTISGVISQTNLQRKNVSSLPALKENAKLNQSAKAKLDDMFKQQYFEHESPQGRGPSDLAKAAGYEYISIGENLALGNFESDADLVEAWMNSPGHRANILNKQYTEIGVAVGQGTYEGRKTWLAVQEFGRPVNSCPVVDQNLKALINSIKEEIAQLEPKLLALKNEMDSSEPKTQEENNAYNQKVADYNAMVKIYNNKVDSLKASTDIYNAEVRDYNACAQAS